MSKFNVGDIAILVYSKYHPQWVGEACEIIGVNVISLDGVPHDYAIQYKNIPGHPITGRWVADEYQLRKKKPPMGRREDVEEFTGWSPFKVIVPKEKQNTEEIK